MYNVIKILFAYCISFLIGTLFFIGLFHTGLFDFVKVFFYRGLLYLLISSVVVSCVMLVFGLMKRHFDVGVRDSVAVCGMFVGITVGWFILVPVTVERSVSVYMLSYMANTGKPIAKERFNDVFYDNYIIEFDAFGKRFNEQLESGNMKKTEEGWVLTKNGERVVKFFNISAELFNTDRRLINAGKN